MGINLSLPNCPVCNQKMPTFRKPDSFRQAMWGGWTCPNCGCEMDKWGKAIKETENNKIGQKQIEDSRINIPDFFDKDEKSRVERIFEEK